MRKRFSRALCGVLIIAIGVLWILSLVGILNFNLFFDGWWTVFIILPCLLGFISKPNWGSIFGMAIGAFLLLQAQGLIDWSLFWKLCVASIIIIIGITLLFSSKCCCSCKKDGKIENINREGKNIKSIECSFGEQNISMDEQDFEGADIDISFGSLTLDLRRAIINDNVQLNVKAAFAGVRILLPSDVNVEVRSNSAFGGISNKADNRRGTYTVVVSAECSFAGVDLR